MVFQFRVLCWLGLANLAGFSPSAQASDLSDVKRLYHRGDYFEAAQKAFESRGGGPQAEADAYAWVTLSLVRAGMPQSATYFFIRTLQSKNSAAIRHALTVSERLLNEAGVDLLRPYLVAHTKIEDYNTENRNAFLYALGKDLLIKGDYRRAVEFLKGVRKESSLWSYALLARGSAHAILGENGAAISDFKACESASLSGLDSAEKKEAQDLKNRCIAGLARTYYQMERFEESDRAYDRIQKASFVWPEVLFEQAWNAFSQREYNRSLGKLVSYKSPALQFVYNSEIEVLNAQSYLALCLYPDANRIVNEFNDRYSKLGEDVKKYVESNAGKYDVFFSAGKKALQERLHTQNHFNRMLNRFVRSPQFQSLVRAEKRVQSERRRVTSSSGGLSGFMNEVLDWRMKNITTVGGVFVKNSLIDYHSVLIENFEKIAFIKLEMLKRAKDELNRTTAREGRRSRGDVEPARKDHQYRWSFNGEYWNDELGDYVFGLESQCSS